MAALRTGEILVKQGLITHEQLKHAVAALTTSGGTLDSKLIELGLVSEEALLATLSKHYSVPTAHPRDLTVDATVIKLVPFSLASKHTIMPVSQSRGILTVAISDPSNISALSDLKFLTGLDLHLCLASSRTIKHLQEQFYESSPAYESLIGDIVHDTKAVQPETMEEGDLSDLIRATEDAPIVKLVNAILSDAIKKNASDIHIEPYEYGVRVRFRIDGVLTEIMRPPPRLKKALTSRLKIMAKLNIAEHRLPQDGRMKVRYASERDTDFRVNVLPTLFGEKVVLRLLDNSIGNFNTARLGFNEKQAVIFDQAISQPHGMVLVTGPTGSGKTTTLYSALATLNTVSTNICTAENPVEINLPGINQTQVNDEIGFTFTDALRAFLRQDPDIIMVGEIRDFETAEIAIKSSMTGHLVLSTLHTNDAPSTINRLLNMGVAPYLVASSLNLIVAQRLVRCICSECKEPTQVPTSSLRMAGLSESESTTIQLFCGKGCSKCSSTGYRGRCAIYEMMPMTEELRELILTGASTSHIKHEAIRSGMQTLRQAALKKLAEGITSFEEVLRVTTS